MQVLIRDGWIYLLLGIAGEMIVPFILGAFYKGYRHTTMVISSLGNDKSPVRIPFRLWMLTAGILFLISIPAMYHFYRPVSKSLIILTLLFTGLFAVGACILSCFFSVNEKKEIVTLSSRIHGFGSALGFMLFLAVPCLLSILSFRSGDIFLGIISLVSFGLALLFFILFILADKPNFHDTWIAREGLWQRLNLLFMYLPLAFLAIKQIIAS